MNILDIIFIVILAFFIWRGIAKGLLLTFGRLAGLVLGYIAGIIFYKDLGQVFQDLWGARIVAILERLPFNDAVLNLTNTADLSKAEHLSALGFNLSAWSQEAAGSIQELFTNFSTSVSTAVLNMLAFVVIFLAVVLVVKIIFKIIAALMSGISLGVWPLFDRIGGAAFGFVRGALLIGIFVIFVSYGYCFVVFDQGGLGVSFYNTFYDSQIASYLLSWVHKFNF